MSNSHAISPNMSTHTPTPRTRLSDSQYAALLEPIHRSRVGQNAKGFSHVEAWDITRTLNRIFGFGGWDYEVVACDEVRTIDHAPGTLKVSKWVDNQKTMVPSEDTRYTVVYRSIVRLVVKAPDGTPVAHFDGVATGDATNQPSLGDAHDMAAKTADSQALKRAAVKLGDQFGLALYNGGGGLPDQQGYLRAVVIRTLTDPWQTAKQTPPAQHEDEPVQPDPETTVDAPAEENTFDAMDDQAYSPAIGAGTAPAEVAPDVHEPSAPAVASTPKELEAAPAAARPTPATVAAARAASAARPTPGPSRPAREPWDTDGAVIGAARPAAPEQTSPAKASPAPAPAASTVPAGETFRLAIQAIKAATNFEQLDRIAAYAVVVTERGLMTFAEAGQTRLKIGSRRDEIAAQPAPSSQPALATT